MIITLCIITAIGILLLIAGAIAGQMTDKQLQKHLHFWRMNK